MEGVSVVTFNVDGIKTNEKRNKIFTFFENSQYDIICLQETHVQPEDINKWKKEWKYYSIWNSGASGKTCGTGILINGRKNIIVTDYKKDLNGRIINIKVQYNKQNIQIVSIYVPDRPFLRENFFLNLRNYLFEDLPIVMGGDFNMVECLNSDRKGGTPSHTHTQGIIQLQYLKNELDIQDMWRKENPKTQEFTWTSRKLHENIQSRLDRFYISQSIKYIKTETVYHVWSDHRLVNLVINIGKQDIRGQNYWKLNTETLHDKQYRTEMTAFITEQKSTKPCYENVIEWWGMTKIQIKMYTKNYCKKINQKRQKKINQIKQKIERESTQVRISITDIELLHNQLQTLQNEKQRGVQIRSREKVILNEEKPTKFFYMKEQQQQQKKTIQSLKSSQPTKIVTETRDILKSIHEFFSEVYSKQTLNTELQDEYLQHTQSKLTEQDRQNLDLPITAQELFETIQRTDTNKSPGIDGLPIEFYETFWTSLKNEIHEMANLIYIENNRLDLLQQTGIITLSHKRDDKENLENWRPITLLCADYKMITKTIATRLRKFLGRIIHMNQTCAVPDREITSNLYLVRDIIKYAQYKDIDTFIISYDFQQAFDSIDHDYMIAVLHEFNFGRVFINFISNIYTDRTSMVMNNGFLTNRIKINRGILQGCPISLPLFCIVAETLANKLRYNKRIQGIRIPGYKDTLKLIQYADDTNTITTNIHTITETINEFEKFGQATGCKLKENKTKGLIISNTNTDYLENQINQVTEGISWNENTGLKTLGIHFFTDELQTQNYNWKKVIDKLKSKTDLLKTRNLSLRGKVILLNSVTLSKIWYLASIITMPNWAFINIEKIIFKFLWGDTGNEPIKRQTLYLPIHKGGLGLLHPKHHSQALRLKNFFKIVDPNKTDLWICYARYWLARRIVKHNPIPWNFLNDNSCAKYNGTDPPLYYKHLEQLYVQYTDKLRVITAPITTKQLYLLITTTYYENYEIFAETIWNSTFKRVIPWKKLWSHNFSSYAMGKTTDVLFKIMHNCLPTKVRLQKNHHRRGNYSTKCKYCKKNEDTLHIFARCYIATKIWKTFQNTYQKLLPDIRFLYEEAVLTLNLLQTTLSSKTKKLTLTLTNIILFELWTSRNKFEKDCVLPNIERSVKTINSRMTTIISAQYQHYTQMDDLETFISQFAINNALCKIQNGKLYFLLPDSHVN